MSESSAAFGPCEGCTTPVACGARERCRKPRVVKTVEGVPPEVLERAAAKRVELGAVLPEDRSTMHVNLDTAPDAANGRWLRRANRRLRWAKGTYALHRLGAHRAHPDVRRDVVRNLLRQRQWRLALIVALLPVGWSLTNEANRGR